MLAFSRDGTIFISDTGGRAMKKLTDGMQYDIQPQWSPLDGSIGFVRKKHWYETNGTLMIVDTGTTAVRQISELGSVLCLSERAYIGGTDMSRTTTPVWNFSPDGLYAAYYAGNDSATVLRIDRMDGTMSMVRIFPLFVERWMNADLNIAGFCWLPNSRQLICTANPEGETSYLYRVDISGFSMTKIGKRRSAAFPSVTADGRYAGYFSFYEYRYVISDLTSGTDTMVSAGSESPKLSPDGKTIVWFSPSSYNPYSNSSSTLQSINRSTMAITTVALSDGDRHYVFHPSSRWLYLSHYGTIKNAPIPSR